MINKIILVGNVGADPETRNFNNGGSVTSFSVATVEKYTNKEGGKVENTEWHSISMFGKLSEIAEKYVKKGQLIYVEGSLKTRSWDDKDGKKVYKTDVILSAPGHLFKILSGKKEVNSKIEENNITDNQVNEGHDLLF